MNSPVNVMGLPSFQSVSTFAPKKYCLAVAGFTRASHTSELDALMTTEALETRSRSILGFAPSLTHNFIWVEGANRRSVARSATDRVRHPPPLAGIIPVIWSWRNGLCPNDLPEFDAAGPGNWRERHLPGNPGMGGRCHSQDWRQRWMAPIAGARPIALGHLPPVVGLMPAISSGHKAFCPYDFLNSTWPDPGISAGAICPEIRGWAEGAIPWVGVNRGLQIGNRS